MKYLFTIFFISISSILFAQDLDSIGIKNNTQLNKQEALFLNREFSEQYDNYDFTNKLVACMYYTDDFYPRTKIEYFAEARLYFMQGKPLVDKVLILTPKERKKYEGFDLVIVSSYSNDITNKTRQAILKRLKKMVLNVYYGEDYYFE